MLIDLDYVLGSIDTVRKLTAKVRQQCEQMPEGPGKETALAMMAGQDAGLDGLLKLLKIHPDCGTYISEWTPPPPGVIRAS